MPKLESPRQVGVNGLRTRLASKGCWAASCCGPFSQPLQLQIPPKRVIVTEFRNKKKNEESRNPVYRFCIPQLKVTNFRFTHSWIPLLIMQRF